MQELKNKISALMFVILGCLVFPSNAQEQLKDSYIIYDLDIEMPVDNAGNIRDQALNQAVSEAFEKIIESEFPSITEEDTLHIQTQDILKTVKNYEVNDEEQEGNNYRINVTVSFNSADIRKLLNKQIKPIMVAGDNILLIPYVSVGSSGTKLNGDNPWADLWRKLAEKGEYPIIVPFEELEDINLINEEEVLQNNYESLSSLSEKYEIRKIILAEISRNQSGNYYLVTKYLLDGKMILQCKNFLGPYNLTSEKSYKNIADSYMDIITMFPDIVENKLCSSEYFEIHLDKPGDWKILKEKLPGNWLVNNIKAGFTGVIIRYNGSLESLLDSLSSSGFELSANNDIWMMRLKK